MSHLLLQQRAEREGPFVIASRATPTTCLRPFIALDTHLQSVRSCSSARFQTDSIASCVWKFQMKLQRKVQCYSASRYLSLPSIYLQFIAFFNFYNTKDRVKVLYDQQFDQLRGSVSMHGIYCPQKNHDILLLLFCRRSEQAIES